MAPHAADCKGAPREPCRSRADGPSRVREGEDGSRLNGTATGAGLPRGPPLDPRRPPAAAHHRKPRPACTRGTRFLTWGPPHRVVLPAGGVPGPRPGQRVRPACTRGTGFQAEPPLRDGRMSESQPRVYTRRAISDTGPPRRGASPVGGKAGPRRRRKVRPACTRGARFPTWARPPRPAGGDAGPRARGRAGSRAPRAAPSGIRPLPFFDLEGQLPGSALRASHLAISRRAPMRPHPESARPRRRPPRERKPPQERGTEGQLDPSAPVTAVMCALRLRTQTRPASSAGSGSAAAPARPRCGSRVLRRGPWGCG